MNGCELGLATRMRRTTAEGLPAAIMPGLNNRMLAALVLQTVRDVKDEELFPPAASQGAAFQPKAILVTLVYCYAIGVYGSWDIEQMMYEDADFRALCGRDYPDWRRFRRFRRDNHVVLRRILEETFRHIWSSSTGATRVASGHRAAAPVAANDWLADEAGARIERAMFIDQLAGE